MKRLRMIQIITAGFFQPQIFEPLSKIQYDLPEIRSSKFFTESEQEYINTKFLHRRHKFCFS